MLNNKKVLITGHKGYIGRNLLKYLKLKKIKFKKTNTADLQKKNYAKYKFLIHLSFFIKDKKKNVVKNVNELKNIVNFCIKNKIYLIFPSTSSFKFINKKRVGNSIYPFNYYTLSKKKCEEIIVEAHNKYKLNYTILRIFNVYGGDLENKYYISKIIKQFKKSKKFSKIRIKYKNNMRDYVHMNDLFFLILKVMNKQINGTFEVGSGKSISIDYLARKINKICKKENLLIFPKPYKSKLNYFSKSNIIKTKKVFNWEPIVKIDNSIKTLLK